MSLKNPLSANRQKTDKKRPAPKSAFKPGQSGNPSGRPKKTEEEFELERACERKTPEALESIVQLMTSSKQDSVRLAAAAYIIERRYGKAIQRSEVKVSPLDELQHDELKKLHDAIGAIGSARGAFPASPSSTRH